MMLTNSDTLYQRPTFDEWLATRYLPIAGAEDPPADADADPNANANGDADADPNANANANANADADADANANANGNSDDDDDPDDVLELRRSDYERLRQSAREHDKMVKDAAKAEQDRKRKQQIEQGKFEEMLREEAETRLATEAERDTAREELATERMTRRVEAVAKRLGFKDPEDAMAFMSKEDGADDAATERALKKIARRKPYLVDTRRPTGVPVGGPNGTILTLEAIKNMSEDEVNANWTEVQRVLATG